MNQLTRYINYFKKIYVISRSEISLVSSVGTNHFFLDFYNREDHFEFNKIIIDKFNLSHAKRLPNKKQINHWVGLISSSLFNLIFEYNIRLGFFENWISLLFFLQVKKLGIIDSNDIEIHCLAFDFAPEICCLKYKSSKRIKFIEYQHSLIYWPIRRLYYGSLKFLPNVFYTISQDDRAVLLQEFKNKDCDVKVFSPFNKYYFDSNWNVGEEKSMDEIKNYAKTIVFIHSPLISNQSEDLCLQAFYTLRSRLKTKNLFIWPHPHSKAYLQKSDVRDVIWERGINNQILYVCCYTGLALKLKRKGIKIIQLDFSGIITFVHIHPLDFIKVT